VPVPSNGQLYIIPAVMSQYYGNYQTKHSVHVPDSSVALHVSLAPTGTRSDALVQILNTGVLNVWHFITINGGKEETH
jgi:hypothetical protein